MTGFPLVTVASPLHDPDLVDALVERLRGPLEAAGATPTSDPSLADRPGPLALLVLTGGTEEKVLELQARHSRALPGAPIVLVAHPGHNSLPAALEALARLHQDGARSRMVVVHPGEHGSAAVATALADLAAWHRLRDVRLGRIGNPSDWLVASSPDADVVREVWGPSVVDVPVADLVAPLDVVGTDAAAALAHDVAARAVRIGEPRRADLAAASRVASVLDRLVVDHRLDAVTVRCFDLVTEAATSGCLALSELNDRGVVAGCEGDVPSALGLLWVHVLLGRTAWMANPADADPEAGRVVLAHCTAPRTLLASYELRSHFESGLGTAIAGTLPPGPVTLLRIGGRRLDALWLAEGQVTPAPRREDGCRTQVTVEVPAGAVSELLARPLGNHVVLVTGHHAARLRSWWKVYVATSATDEPSGAQGQERTTIRPEVGVSSSTGR